MIITIPNWVLFPLIVSIIWSLLWSGLFVLGGKDVLSRLFGLPFFTSGLIGIFVLIFYSSNP